MSNSVVTLLLIFLRFFPCISNVFINIDLIKIDMPLGKSVMSRLGLAGISTPWPFRYPQPVKMPISIAPSPRLSGTGMTSLNPLFLPLNCKMIAYLRSTLL